MDAAHKNQAGEAFVRRIEANGPGGSGLVAWEALDPATLAAGTPVQSGYLYDEDEARGYSAGVWHCTPFDDAPGPYPVDEYMLLLEGVVVMALPDGQNVRIEAGEAFVLPQGFECQWKMPKDVRKVFMIVENDGRTTSKNTSLAKVIKPSMIPLAYAADAVETSQTVFASADGQMTVARRGYGAPFRGPVPSAGQRIVTVLSGGIKIGDAYFGVRDSVFVDARDRSDWHIAAGTTWLEASHINLAARKCASW
ncbi:MAG: cupin domain-containing protein [Pseudomonadota bacterium]